MTSLLVALLLAAETCERCHEAEAAAFAQSRHAVARTLPVFTRSLAHAKPRWCLGCHQPEGKGDGLTCQGCHRVEGAPGAVLSTHATQPGRTSHPVVVTPSLEVSACERCHEFNAPLPGHLDPVVLSDQPLQSTVSELRKAMPGVTCSGCHDPHRAEGAHDRALLARALVVEARAVDGGVDLALTVGRTGHRFPTGDPFRRLVLSTCRDEACADVVGQRVLARSHGLTDAGVWAPLRDTTLASEERRVVRLPAAPYWSARYFFGDPRFEPGLPAEEVSALLGAGRVP